jgi:hypothetical protein
MFQPAGRTAYLLPPPLWLPPLTLRPLELEPDEPPL